MEEGSKNILFAKLEKFIRKYYLNKVVKGVLISLIILLLFFLAVNICEYFGYFDTIARKTIFFSFIGIGSLVFCYYIIYPLLQILRIGKRINYEDAARIIGKHLGEVSDKLLNCLQLLKVGKNNKTDLELINASIEQKSKEFKYLRFHKAIKIKENKKYLKYLLPVTLIIIMLLLLTPKLITNPTKRLIKYNTEFERPKPFQIELINEELKAVKQEDFNIEAVVKGNELPADLYIQKNDNSYRMNKIGKTKFVYTVKNVQRNFEFFLFSGDIRSDRYRVEVYPKPIILSYDIKLDYPDYTGKKDEIIENNGELIINEGTNVTWKIYTRDTEEVVFVFNGKRESLKDEKNNTYKISKEILKPLKYSITTKNKFVDKRDTLHFNIDVIRDAYPKIKVTQFIDSTELKRRFFSGIIKDDYGFSELNFKYIIKNDENDTVTVEQRKDMKIDFTRSEESFNYQIHLDSFDLRAGNIMEYYFEVWDNDKVNGYKKTKSEKFVYRKKRIEEIEKEVKDKTKNIEEELKRKNFETKEINKKIDDLIKQLLTKDKIDWKDKKKVEELLDQQKEIHDELRRLNEENIKRNRLEEEYMEQNESILEKQKELQELFEKLVDEETKKKIEELRKMVDELYKDQIRENLEDIKMSNEELQKQLDRNINLFKQLELEKLLNETIDKLEKAAKKQDELSKEIKDGNNKTEEVMQEQKELRKEMDDIDEKINDAKEKNKQLEYNEEMPETEELSKRIKELMEESLKNINDSELKNASENQVKAADGMKKMMDLLIQFKNQMTAQRQGEDMEKIREILENLVLVSFRQEDLMTDLKNVNKTDPKYLKIMDIQQEIKDEAEFIEDSLYAISKRQLLIAPFINEKSEEINKNIDNILEALHERNISRATMKQQQVMTSINDLALLLAESIKKMQSNIAMQNAMAGEGKCPMPGGAKKRIGSIGQMQQALNEQLKQLKEQMKSSNKGKGKKGTGERFARMAAQQEMIRNKLQDYMDELKKQGINDDGLKQAIEEMQKTEKDIVNKIIDQRTLERQKEILTRLLRSEKAEIEREKSKKRESEEAKYYKKSNKKTEIEYKQDNIFEQEYLRSINPKMKKFYRQKVNQYLYEYMIEK